MIPRFKHWAMRSSSSWFASAGLSQARRRVLIYKISEPNSPSLTRVRIFIFGRTAAMVRMIFPRSFMVMLYPRRNVASGPSTPDVMSTDSRARCLTLPRFLYCASRTLADEPVRSLRANHLPVESDATR